MIVQIVVRVPWDGSDDPEVRSMQWLANLIAESIYQTEPADTCRCVYDIDTGIIDILRIDPALIDE